MIPTCASSTNRGSARFCAARRKRSAGGGPVKAMLVQSTNPVAVAPAQDKVRRGFAREDLFVCVHEHFMTDDRAHGRYRAAGDDVPRT